MRWALLLGQQAQEVLGLHQVDQQVVHQEGLLRGRLGLPQEVHLDLSRVGPVDLRLALLQGQAVLLRQLQLHQVQLRRRANLMQVGEHTCTLLTILMVTIKPI